MYGINEIQKQNSFARGEDLAARSASFAPLRDGTVLLRFSNRARVVGGEFLDLVRGKTNQQIKAAIEAEFATA